MDTASCFGHYLSTDGLPRQWLPAVVTSASLYTGIVLALVAAGSSLKQVARPPKPVSVKFVQTVVKPESPQPVAAAPVASVPKATKAPKRHVPPPPKTLTAPTELPHDIPAQAEPSPDQGPAVWVPDESELEAGVRGTGGVKDEITEQMQGVTPAAPYKTNEVPEYPPTARHTWTTDRVVLKIRITTDGQVRDVQVLQGEEPFITEAENAVKRWRYSPARYHGEPISVYRIIKIAFQLA